MKALVIAGGVPQIELIKQLKSRGITTVLADGSPNAVARPYADIFYNVNIFDIPAVKEIAEKEKVDFLLTVCADQVLLVVAEVSELLGLPCYIDYKTAQDVSDKIRMKRIFKRIGVPTTDYVETDHLDMDSISHLHYPLVVKPVDAYSSKGVRKAGNLEELKQYYAEAQTISRSGGVIVEEFFQGDEISVDAFVVNGKAKVLTVSNSEKVKDNDRFVIFRGRYPVAASDVVLEKIKDIAQKIANGFGLVNAPLLIQLLNNGDDVSVLEFCARTGGNMKWLLIKYSCGVDVITATIDITLGKEPDLEVRDTGHKIVVDDFVYCYPGVFDHFEGFDEMVEQGLINEFHPVRIKGTEMKGVTSSGDRICGMNIVADSIEEFNAKEKKILRNVRVVDINGNDIMRRDLLPGTGVNGMNTKQLQYVLTLAHEGSFSRAADVLNITQPSLSQYIKKIEREIGLELFDRTNGDVRITDAGCVYIEAGKKILDIEHQMENSFTDLADHKIGSLIIGAAPYRAASMMPVIAKQFQSLHPGMNLNVREGTTAELVEGMEHGEYDLALTLMPIDKRLFNYESVLEEELILAVPSSYPLFFTTTVEGRKHPAIDASVLNGASMVMLTDTQFMQKQLENLILDHHLDVHPAAIVKSLEAQIEFVKAGVGMALMPSGIERFCKPGDVAFYSFTEPLPRREVVVMWRKDQKLSKTAEELKEVIHAIEW